MSKTKITKRDILFFFLGIVLCFILDVIFNWDGHVEAFKQGVKDAQKPVGVERLK